MTPRLHGVAFALLSACSSDPAIQTNPDGPAPAACPVDESAGTDSAVELGDGEAAQGHVCPVGDVDVFELRVPAGSDLVGVELANDVPLTAVDLSYTLLGTDKAALGGAGDPDGADGTTAVARHHRAAAGQPLFVLVRDQGDDEQDVRNPYTLRVSGARDPDPDEPNDAIEVAAPFDGSASGLIASLGDTDIYALNLADATLLDVRLSAVDLAIGLRVRWLDDSGAELLDLEAPMSAMLESGVGTLRAVPAAGIYYLAVSAWDGVSEDFDTPYLLEANAIADPDPNEAPARNDAAALATPLFGGAAYDGSATASDVISEGRIASGDDQDWYVLETAVPAILDVTLNGPAPLEWTLNLIAPAADTPCAQDDECVTLSTPCEADWECLSACAGAVSGSCPDGQSCFCQGAGVCLPEALCGVPQFTRTIAGGGAAAQSAQPLLVTGRHYLVVADQGGDEWSASAYSLSLGLRVDPDASEPDNDYDPYPLNTTPAEPSLCDASGGPCGAPTLAIGSTTTGHIAYESDFDYVRLDLPCCDAACPCGGNADVCGFVLEFGADPGPVGPVWELFAGSSGGAAYWGGFDLALVPDGVLGDDECFVYSRFVDIAAGEAVYVRVRDDLDDGAQWDPGQSYYVRLTSAGVGCPAGCTAECTDLCGAPCTAPDTPAGCCDHDPSGTPAACGADGGTPDAGVDGPPGDM